jgi:protein O-GlcNAc transferase
MPIFAPRNTGNHPRLPEAVSLHQAGRLGEAARLYSEILAEMPSQFDAAHLLGVIALQQGRFADAQRHIGAALEMNPRDPAALSNLATSYLRDNNLSTALKYAQLSCEAQHDSVEGLINLGSILRQMGRVQDAIVPLRKAYELNPNATIVLNLLGACLLDSGEAPQAARMFEAATRVAPENGDGWANLAAALNAMSEHAPALQCAERAIALRGDSSAALGAQAASQFELGKIEESIATYRSAMRFSPSLQILCAFATALISSGLNDEGLEVLQRAVDMDASNPAARWAQVIAQIKPIFERASDIEVSRRRFSQGLAEMRDWFDRNPQIPSYQVVGMSQPFYLAYHPFNNKDLLSQYGQLCVRFMQSLPGAPVSAPMSSRSTPKMRIGIASAHIREHSVWFAITKGWVQHLDRNRFEVYLFQLHPITDAETKYARQIVDHFEDQPASLSQWIAAIKNAQLDALIFSDVGMDRLTAQLASLRLAPVQAVTWGHPETTGIPTIDIYFSAEALEPPDAQNNYSEKLIRLPNLGVYVDPLTPKTLDPKLKAMGLPKNEPLLLCPGTTFKYSPGHDWVWVEIAKGLEKRRSGRLVFFTSSSGSMSLLLTTRLRRVFAESGMDFDARVCMIPLLDRARFFGLMGHAALMLDTLGFSGFNTAIQGIECGLPVLAYEGEFMRGRLASCLMRRMDLPELIAGTHAEFVQRALALSGDRRELKRLRAEIVKRRAVLFQDLEPVRALGNVLQEEIESRRRGNLSVTSSSP